MRLPPYRSYAPDELAAQYDTSKQLADGNVGAYFARFEAASAATRDALAHDADVRYGPHERETLDAFAASAPGAPLLVWIHGGYWRRLSKSAASLVAGPLVAAGAAVAVINYPLAPDAALDDIVAAVRRGYAFARAHAAAWNADPGRTYVGGHSVGAQLAATVAAAFPVNGLVALSGLYDLEPLRATPINEWIKMDAATAARNAPIALRPLGAPSLLAAVGGREQAEFRRQQREYVAAWRAWGLDARVVDASEHDHFTIVLDLADPRGALARAVVETLGLDATTRSVRPAARTSPR